MINILLHTFSCIYLTVSRSQSLYNCKKTLFLLQIRKSLFSLTMATNRYCVEYAKRGTASCKNCKKSITKESARIGKIVPNPFSDSGGDMKQWYHIPCIFQQLSRARATTKRIEDPDDLEGFDTMEEEDKDIIIKHIQDLTGKTIAVKKISKKKEPSLEKLTPPAKISETDSSSKNLKPITASNPDHKDNSFREFRRLCADIAEENSYNAKTQIVANFLNKDGFGGDVYLLLKLLLPGIVKRVYNLNNKQLIKLFGQMFAVKQEAMITDLEQGDVAETIKTFFEQSKVCQPAKKSNLTIYEVDEYLENLSKETKEEDQVRILTKIAKKCTANDLKMVVRLIKHDLRINAGAKHILEALDPNAYPAFQASRDLQSVVSRVLNNKNDTLSKPGMTKSLSIRSSLMTPVLPMLAEACKNVEQAFKKCPNGMYAEIKYDGERVQVHKHGQKFEYFSRSLKPVLPHKVQHFKDYIPKAFPHGQDLILDSEVLLIDANTSKPLPFGSLGIHKKSAFKNANVCLFVFDCLYLNGQNLMEKSIKERRKILHENMKEIPNRIMFSEMTHVTKREELEDLIAKVIREGLEGLVLKDLKSIYEPGKRHWLKVKKDYLDHGAMADSADLVVLGAFYGTGNKGGLMSVFLMGCYDQASGKWCTVTKVGNGHDDKTLERLNVELNMIKISKDMSKIPSWLKINKTVAPDFVSANPKEAPVWEITGAEFSKSDAHTADGISIRFPRVTKIRDDKSWKEATDLSRLKELYKKSKETCDILPKVKNNDNKNNGSSNHTNETTSSTKSRKRKLELDLETSSKKVVTSINQAKTNGKQLPKFENTYKSNSMRNNSASKPLPDVFQNVKLYLSPPVEDYELLVRYFISFNGELIEEYEKNEATHVIAHPKLKVESFPSTAHLVTENWLWDCIRLKKLLPVKPYKLS